MGAMESGQRRDEDGKTLISETNEEIKGKMKKKDLIYVSEPKR